MTTTRVNDDLQTIYHRRFTGKENYRQQVWGVLLSDFFQRFVPIEGAVLDLGSGYGEFINGVRCGARYAMDLNPDAGKYLDKGVQWFQQDCSHRWPLADNSLDVVFTSNFFEHLPDKSSLRETLREARRCLRPGGRLIALGPNIKYLGGAYWDFWDHHVSLTEASLAEVLQTIGFKMERVIPKFLPYTMSDGRQYPLFLLRLYLRLAPAWRFFGRQFLVVAAK
jgi:SAM-dependent methyltransferase